MKARFIGENGSNGLVQGNVYDVEIWPNTYYISVDWGKGACHYSTWQDLYKDWRIERSHDPDLEEMVDDILDPVKTLENFLKKPGNTMDMNEMKAMVEVLLDIHKKVGEQRNG